MGAILTANFVAPTENVKANGCAFASLQIAGQYARKRLHSRAGDHLGRSRNHMIEGVAVF